MTARSALRVVKRRAAAAGSGPRPRLSLLPGDGITACLVHGGTLERAAATAGHASTRTTQLYDRWRKLVEPDEVERVKLLAQRPVGLRLRRSWRV
ncbi:MAG TPA: hypothetical protein VHR45_11410 [Thermoanaerobaculia bacterium]|nr:hypothetical protein [Thermoanaerobaculia bacterium]